MKEKRQATRITVGNDAESPTIYRKAAIGRNQPCPCGSGKKAKNCCGTTPVYGYRKLRLKVTPERYLKKTKRFPFEQGETVLASDTFPVQAFRGRELVVMERGFEEHVGVFYFKVAPVSDPEHLINTELWYADGHLEKASNHD